MYPIHLEGQYESLFSSEFDKFSKKLTARLKPIIDIAKRKESGENQPYNNPVKQDAGDPFAIIESIRHSMIDSIDSSDDGKIEKVFQLLNAWSHAKVSESLDGLTERLNTPQPSSITGRPTPTGLPGERWIITVPLKTPMIDAILERTIHTNAHLKSSLFAQHANDICDILSNGFANGSSAKALTDAIQHATGVDRNRARFWACDQASKFFGEVTREKQISSGIPGYIWRTIGDGHVRDEDAHLNGTYHLWTDPPPGGHPGQKYRCRCWAEPAFGKEYEDPLAIRNTFEDTSLQQGMVAARSMLSEIANITKITAPLDIQESANLQAYGAYAPQSGRILLRSGIESPISTATHEMSHYLDHKIFGNGRRTYGSASVDYASMRKELQNTEMIKSFDRIYRRGKIVENIDIETGEVSKRYSYKVEGKSYRIKVRGIGSIDYYTDPREVFARTMEKYFAIKSGNKTMMNEITRKENFFIDMYGFSQYPSDKDVKSLIPTIDNYFKRLQ